MFHKGADDAQEVPYQYVCARGDCRPGEPGAPNTSWVAMRGADGVANDLLFGLLILAAAVAIIVTFLFVQLKWYYICCPPKSRRRRGRRDISGSNDSFWRPGDEYKYGAVKKGLIHDVYEPTLNVPDEMSGIAW